MHSLSSKFLVVFLWPSRRFFESKELRSMRGLKSYNNSANMLCNDHAELLLYTILGSPLGGANRFDRRYVLTLILGSTIFTIATFHQMLTLLTISQTYLPLKISYTISSSRVCYIFSCYHSQLINTIFQMKNKYLGLLKAILCLNAEPTTKAA